MTSSNYQSFFLQDYRNENDVEMPIAEPIVCKISRREITERWLLNGDKRSKQRRMRAKLENKETLVNQRLTVGGMIIID